MQSVTLVISLISGIIALALSGYKFSSQLNKLNQIDIIEEKIDQINDNLVKDLVSISLLNQRVDILEGEVKEIKNNCKKGGGA